MNQAQQASIAEKPRQYSLQELPFPNVKSLGSRGSVLMLAVRFEEVVSRGAGAAVALFSGAVIREMYRTKILSVKVLATVALFSGAVTQKMYCTETCQSRCSDFPS